MSKKITDNTTKATAAAADWVLINDVSASTDKKTSVAGPAAAVGANLPAATVTPSMLATGALSAYVATSETTTSTSYADLTTTSDTVTVTIGANGVALVAIAGLMNNNTGDAESRISFAVSGASTIAAGTYYQSDQQQNPGANHQRVWGSTFVVTGLTAGSTTFKMKYSVSSGTGTFAVRRIGVVPL